MIGPESITEIPSQEERSKIVSDLISQGDIDIHFAATLPPSLKLETPQILESLLLNAWLLPSRELGNRIPAKGTTNRLVKSFSLNVLRSDQQLMPVQLVSKRVHNFNDAVREQSNLEKIQTETKVRAVKPFAVLGIKDTERKKEFVTILTILERGIVPLERLRFESFHPDQRKTFVNELADFSAELGNEGVIHRDFILRNIGYDVTQRRNGYRNRSEFLFFDMENSSVIDRTVLSRMKETDGPSDMVVRMRDFSLGEGLLDDAVDVARELMARLPVNYIREEYVRVYINGREPIYTHKSPKENMDYIMRHARFLAR